MSSGRSIAAFAVKFLVIYGALAASWPVCRPGYAFFLRESGNILFEAVGPHDHVRIGAYTSPDGMNDTALFIRNAAAELAVQITMSSWLIGFQPTSVLVGLVLATPVNMRRRIWALFSGLVMVHAFVLTRLATFVIFAPLVLPDTFWVQAFWCSVDNFIHSYAVSCFAPVLIWIAVTMRREDARRLVPSSVKDVRDTNASHA